MKKLITVLLVCLALVSCKMGDVDINVPTIDANYTLQTREGIKATIDGVDAFYTTNLYTCVETLFYRLPLAADNAGILNLDGSVALCEVDYYSYTHIENTDLQFIEI